MKSLNLKISTGLVLLVIALGLSATPASAQYYPAGGHAAWNNYANQAQANWQARREYYLGPMNVVNRTVFSVQNWTRTAVHNVRTTMGNPDYGYYDRYDRKPVVSRGPNPYGGAYAGYGYANGYSAGVNNGYVVPAQQYYRAAPQYQPAYGYGVNVFGR